MLKKYLIRLQFPLIVSIGFGAIVGYFLAPIVGVLIGLLVFYFGAVACQLDDSGNAINERLNMDVESLNVHFGRDPLDEVSNPMYSALACNIFHKPEITADDKTFLDTLRNLFKPADPVAALRADLTARDTTIAGLTAQVTDFTAKLGVITGERDTLTGKLSTLEIELKAEKDGFQAKLDKEVTARLAAAGIDPIKRDPKAGKTGDPADPATAMSLDEFRALSPKARLQFSQGGGKLIDTA